jgi:2-methylisocitrate lyase-like PEP mutase family enzyme
MLSDQDTYVVPGAFDGITAKVVEKVGFQLMSITGNGLSASALGLPDVGLMSMREVVDCSRNIANCTTIPVIGDADTGYGSALNTIRAVSELEQAGLAGIHIEDQVVPKKCAYYEGKRDLVSAEQHIGKIKAAISARKNPDFCIIARTDALRVYGFEEAVKRGRLYTAAGADALFVVGLSSPEEIARFKREVSAPLIVNVNDGSSLSEMKTNELNKLGVKFVFYPATLRSAVAQAAYLSLLSLYQNGNTEDVKHGLMSLADFSELMNANIFQTLEREYVRD